MEEIRQVSVHWLILLATVGWGVVMISLFFHRQWQKELERCKALFINNLIDTYSRKANIIAAILAKMAERELDPVNYGRVVEFRLICKDSLYGLKDRQYSLIRLVERIIDIFDSCHKPVNSFSEESIIFQAQKLPNVLDLIQKKSSQRYSPFTLVTDILEGGVLFLEMDTFIQRYKSIIREEMAARIKGERLKFRQNQEGEKIKPLSSSSGKSAVGS